VKDLRVQEYDRRTTKRAETLRRLADEIDNDTGPEVSEAVAHIIAAAEQAESLIIGTDSDVTYMVIPTVKGQDREVTLIGQLWSMLDGCDLPQLRRVIGYLQGRLDELEMIHGPGEGVRPG
jgi:hypothetical protein